MIELPVFYTPSDDGDNDDIRLSGNAFVIIGIAAHQRMLVMQLKFNSCWYPSCMRTLPQSYINGRCTKSDICLTCRDIIDTLIDFWALIMSPTIIVDPWLLYTQSRLDRYQHAARAFVESQGRPWPFPEV
jgi:hypothetical protein